MNVMIAGGGTGGHIYIGVAVARELGRRNSAYSFIFLGTHQGLESKIIPSEGYRLELLDAGGLKGMSPAALLRNVLRIPPALLHSRRLIARYRPGVVIGVGGYSSGPVLVAAWWSGRPTLIIEPNAYPGLTNRWLGRIARAAAVAFPSTAPFFGPKAHVTGIPVRSEFRNLTREELSGSFTLLVYGGSQGSRALNRIVCSELAGLKTLGPSLRIIHQTGEKEFAAVSQAYTRAGVSADVRPFLPRIYEELARADVVLSRAGAGTVAELTVAGRAAILVPFPHAADDHQTSNARELERAGAALHITEAEWKPGRLAREVARLQAHPEELQRMEQAARGMAQPDAAARIADIAEALMQGSPIRPQSGAGKAA